MGITSKMKMITMTRNLALSQFRIPHLKTLARSGSRINRPLDDPNGISEDLGFRSDLQESSQFRISINQAFSQSDISARALAEAEYQDALASAARMIQPSSYNFFT
jgi:flagellin-like hook-associated protein FlgL